MKKNIFLFVLYIGIFSLISVFLIKGQDTAEYKESRIATYILVEEESKESIAWVEFLEKQVQVVDLKKGISVEDALFWDDIDLYLFLPKDFYERILQGEEGIVMKASPDSLEAMSVISLLTSYINTIRETIRLGICEKDTAISYVAERFEEEDSISIELTSKKSTGMLRGMFDMAVYVVCALILVIVGLVSFEIRTTDINRRLRISSYSTGKRNLVFGICYAVFSIFFVGIITCLGMALFPDQITSRIGLYIMNMILFAITMVFMALFLSSLFKSDMAYSCVSNVIPLVSAFLCGCFISQELLPDATKAVGHIFPNFYIVEANRYIQTAKEFHFLNYLGIVWPCFLFILLFIGGSILITNHMARSEN